LHFGVVVEGNTKNGHQARNVYFASLVVAIAAQNSDANVVHIDNSNVRTDSVQ